METKIGLYSPWVVYYKKVKAFFKSMEDEVKIVLTNTDSDNPVIKYYVNSKSRRAALGKYLPSSVSFGNITLINEVVEADNRISDKKSTFTDIFSNWKSVSYIEKMSGWSPVLCWIVFNPTVVQYDNDNIQSPDGISTTLYEDLAREIFGENIPDGYYFSTNKIPYCTSTFYVESCNEKAVTI